jgi:hypothetical protein
MFARAVLEWSSAPFSPKQMPGVNRGHFFVTVAALDALDTHYRHLPARTSIIGQLNQSKLPIYKYETPMPPLMSDPNA